MRRRLTFLLSLLVLSIGLVSAQVSKVTGVVVSAEDGEPVIGASVLVVGTNLGTITDIDGKYEIANVPADAKHLRISYVGMETQQVSIKPGMIRTELRSDTEVIDEVVVVAYGTAKKSSFTGSASVVGAKNIEKRAITNATSALEGNTSGVQVTSALGQPGESASVRIRGFGSVNASNAPLYVVDGAVYNGDISNINPSDIESMTVLKDAASTSLYGSSAGNGVILITTKKGSNTSGGTGITLNISQGWSSRAYDDYARVGVYDYYPLQWQMLKNSRISSGDTAEEAALYASENIIDELKYNPFVGVADTEIVGTDGRLNPAANALKWGDDLDWEDAAYSTGYRQEYNVSYNSSNEKSDSYASVGYLKDNGYMLKTDFERYSGRVNYNVYPVKWFKSGVNLGLVRTNSNYSTSTSDNSSGYSNLSRFIRTMAPIYPVHKHDLETGEYLDAENNSTTDPSQYTYDYEGARISSNGRDAIAETLWNEREISNMNTTARVYATIMPIEGLSLTVNYALENTDLRRKVYENPLVGDGTSGPGRLNLLTTRTLTQTFNQLINYNKSFGNHTFDILLGHENYEYKYEYEYAMKIGEVISGIYDFENFTSINELSSYTNRYRKEGYFGRLNYDYADKYYASISYRHDGSSRFSKDNRWGNFWSFGASWRISEEDFMKDISWLSNLKLRASYGQTGNDAILDADDDASYYPYQLLYTLGVNNASEAGIYLSSLVDTNLKWETQVSADVAIEFGLFDNRLTGSLEYFTKQSKDLLFDTSIPLSNGVSSIVQNIGKVKNNGVEFDLNYQLLRRNDWTFSIGVNGTHIKNKVTQLPAGNENGIVTGSKKYMVGHSIYEFWLRQWYGVNPENGDGLYYLDTDTYNEADGTLSESVKSTLVTIDGKQLTNSYRYAKYDYSGSAIPKLYGGFNFNLGYKDFELSAVFSYSLGGKVLDLTYANLMATDEFGYAMSEDVKKVWQKPGDITDVPRLDANSTHATSIGQSYSTRWLTNANYLNLRTVTLSYNLPAKWLHHVMVKNARLSVSAENLFMIKARQGLNPQANYAGVSYNEYMPARNITLGLNVSF